MYEFLLAVALTASLLAQPVHGNSALANTHHEKRGLLELSYEGDTLICSITSEQGTIVQKPKLSLIHTIGFIINSDSWRSCLTNDTGISTASFVTQLSLLLSTNNIDPACPFSYIVTCKDKASFARLLNETLDLSMLEKDTRQAFIQDIVDEYCQQENAVRDNNSIHISF